jgi:hypothetical protein
MITKNPINVFTVARYYFISYRKLTIAQTDGYQQKESYVDDETTPGPSSFQVVVRIPPYRK